MGGQVWEDSESQDVMDECVAVVIYSWSDDWVYYDIIPDTVLWLEVDLQI